jgi:hypothetical protein
MAMSSQEDDQHLREENLPEAVMPSYANNKILKGQNAMACWAALVTGLTAPPRALCSD